jgi:DNA-binding transcriptional regulator YhcF (GntR family)
MKDLSRGARRCLQLLRSYDGPKGCIPFQETLATQLEVSVRTVQRYVRELTQAEEISVEKRQHSSAKYTIQTRQNVGSSVGSKAKNVGSKHSYPYMSLKMSTSEYAREAKMKDLWEQHERYLEWRKKRA